MVEITHATRADLTSLKTLWNDAFGDSEGYIDLFFSSMFRPRDSYVARVNGEPVSALYLLDCEIRLDDHLFEGKYVYAAATGSLHRNKSYMARVVERAVAGSADQRMDFVGLVPASESLGGYYARFGFVNTMRKRVLSLDASDCAEAPDLDAARIEDGVPGGALLRIRDAMIPGPVLRWDERELSYIKVCHEFVGGECLAFGDSSYALVLVSPAEVIVTELVCDRAEVRPIARALMERYERDRCVIHTFHAIGGRDVPFGMTLFLSERIKRAYRGQVIYMNLALD